MTKVHLLQKALRNMLQRLGVVAESHALSLLIVAIFSSVGQAATLMQSPVSYMSWDTGSYVVAAARLVVSPFHIDAVRTVGYPMFLMVIFQLTGGTDYAVAQACNGGIAGGTPRPICQEIFSPVLVAQVAVTILSVLLCYILAFRLSGRRMTACIVASLVGCNLYIITWERTMQTELLSAFSIIATFVVFERLARRPKVLTAVVFALVAVFGILVRPFNVYLPIVLIALLCLRMIMLRDLRRYLVPVALSATMIGVGVIGYYSLNAHENQNFGFTWLTNVEVLGKVIEYRMQDLPADPKYAHIQAEVSDYVANSPSRYPGPDPWSIRTVYPDIGDHGSRESGAYARDIIMRYPLTYLVDSLPDLFRTWQAQPQLYGIFGRIQDGQFHTDPSAISGVSGYNVFGFGVAPTSDEPGWINIVLVTSTFVLGAFWLLPLILLLLAFMAWRSPRNHTTFVMLTLAVAAACAIVLGTLGNFDEFYRMRSPMDWAIIVLTVTLGVEAIASMRKLGGANTASAKASPAHEHTLAPVEAAQALAYTAQTAHLEEAKLKYNNSGHIRPQIGNAADNLDTPKLDIAHDDIVYIDPSFQSQGSPEISIVLPCLNEEEAIGGCIDALQHTILRCHLSAEIVVVDNASTDRSAEIARAHGARVVYQPARGYGNAYLKGFAEARGRYIVMADADNTYDFNEVEHFVEPLRQGYDFVNGNRFSGRMAKGAMSFSHRYLGNPLLSGLLNLFFRTGIRDAHCGMRAFTKEAYLRMRLRTGGMEFASEMVINAAKAGLKITQRPIAYHPRVGESKLHTVRDGWRHLRFLLLYSPTHLFLIPGILLLIVGLSVMGILLPGPFSFLGHTWGVHTMMVASAVSLFGVQIISLGLFARFFSLTEELDGERDVILKAMHSAFTLERGLALGFFIFALGFLGDAYVLVLWINQGFGELGAVRFTVVATALLAMGTEILFSSFFLSFLKFREGLHSAQARPTDSTSSAMPPEVAIKQ